MKEIITFKDFEKKFKKSKVGPFSFKIYEGRTTAIIGTSGSGKSVLLNSLVGAIKKIKGDIIFSDYSRRKSNNYKANDLFGFYTQMDFSLYDISAYKFLKIILLAFGIPKKEVTQRIDYWLNFFDLYSSKDKSVKKFSWGMKNRMNFILCFIKNPQVIIMDEPGANLDSYWRNKIKYLLQQYKEEGKTIIITVHNIDEISDLIDDWIILQNGQKIFEGTNQKLDLYKKYRIVFSGKFDFESAKEYLTSKKIRVMKYRATDNSFTIAIDKNKMINYVFLYSLENNLPLERVDRVPIDMESIHKALEDVELEIKNTNKESSGDLNETL